MHDLAYTYNKQKDLKVGAAANRLQKAAREAKVTIRYLYFVLACKNFSLQLRVGSLTQFHSWE